MASTVEELYQQYAGRASDAAGADYWKQQFGDSISAEEAAVFERSVATVRSEEAAAASPKSVTELYQKILGRNPETAAVVDMWTGLLGSTIEPADIQQFMQGAQPELDRTAAASPAQTTLKRQILAQGTTESWSGQGFGTIEANADAMASILAQTGITDIRQFGELPGGGYGNTTTGQAVPNTYGERQNGNAWGGTYAGKGNTGFRVDFAADGTPVFYTNPQSSNTVAGYLKNPVINFAANAATTLLGPWAPVGAAALQLAAGNSVGDAVKAGALSFGAKELASTLGIGGGGGSSGVSTATDASFAAADAAQLAAQGLSEAQIASTLVSSGMSTAGAGLAAAMATSGLGADTITQQLDALSKNTGLMSQIDNPAGFAAQDALQLRGQVGNNFASIEQNLIASGVDPLIAADISQQLAFNPNLTQSELETSLAKSYGGNIYDVNMTTTYPTSVLPGAGGLMSDIPVGITPTSTTPTTPTVGTTPTTAPTTGTGLTSDTIANIIKAGGALAGLGATRGTTPTASPITPYQPANTMPTYSPEYFQSVQQGYNQLLPNAPKDVITPLQAIYNPQKSIVNTLFGG